MSADWPVRRARSAPSVRSGLDPRLKPEHALAGSHGLDEDDRQQRAVSIVGKQAERGVAGRAVEIAGRTEIGLERRDIRGIEARRQRDRALVVPLRRTARLGHDRCIDFRREVRAPADDGCDAGQAQNDAREGEFELVVGVLDLGECLGASGFENEGSGTDHRCGDRDTRQQDQNTRGNHVGPSTAQSRVVSIVGQFAFDASEGPETR